MSTAAPVKPEDVAPTPEHLQSLRDAFADATPGAGDREDTPAEPEKKPETPPAPAPAKPEAGKEPIAPEVKPDVKPGDAPAAPVIEPPVPEEQEMPKNLTPKAQAGWKEINKKLRETTGEATRLRQENEELKEKAKTAAANPAAAEESTRLTARLQQQEKELEDMRREMASTHLERTPEFKKVFSEPIANATRQIAAIAESAGHSAADFLKIADEPDEAKRRQMFKAAAADLDSIDQGEMRGAIETLAKKKADSTRILADSKTALDVVEKERAQREEAAAKTKQEQFAKQSQSAFHNTFKKLQDSDPMFKPVPGNDDWNAQLEKLRDLGVRVDMDPKLMSNHEARAEMVYHAIGYELATRALKQVSENLGKENKEQKAEIEKLKSAVARLSSGTPAAGSPPAPPAEAPEPDEKEDLADRLARRVQKDLGFK